MHWNRFISGVMVCGRSEGAEIRESRSTDPAVSAHLKDAAAQTSSAGTRRLERL